MPGETNLDSFVVRFVHDTPDSAEGVAPHQATSRAQGWYGMVRHVQSNRERQFTRWADALAFIAEFVDLSEAPDES